jgi:hypothetical protein
LQNPRQMDKLELLIDVIEDEKEDDDNEANE